MTIETMIRIFEIRYNQENGGFQVPQKYTATHREEIVAAKEEIKLYFKNALETIDTFFANIEEQAFTLAGSYMIPENQEINEASRIHRQYYESKFNEVKKTHVSKKAGYREVGGDMEAYYTFVKKDIIAKMPSVKHVVTDRMYADAQVMTNQEFGEIYDIERRDVLDGIVD